MPSVEISYKAVVRLRPTLEKMSERPSGGNHEGGSVGSSQGSNWRDKGIRDVKIGIAN